MKNVIICSIIILLVFFSTGNTNAYSIDQVSYSIRGDLDELKFLDLRIGSRVDHINSTGISIIHDGETFKLQGDWWIRFLQRPEYSISLKFTLPMELDKFSLGRGIGFYGEVFTSNNLYWDINYYFDKDTWVYEGGFLYPMNSNTKLLLGIGNTYWSSDKANLHFGFEMEI